VKIKSYLIIVFCLVVTANICQAKKFTVGVSVWTGYPPSVQGFKESLSHAGLQEGVNVNYIYRNAGGDKDKQVAIAKEFADMDVDLVYSLTTSGTIIIKQYLPDTTPIVFSIVTYPEDAGLIESFDYSGNNLVGTSNYVPLTNYVDFFKKILPASKKVAIFRRDKEPNSKIQAVNLIRLFKREGVTVIDQPADSVESLKLIAEKIAPEVDAFITTTDTLMQRGGEKILTDISMAKKIPILSSNKQGIIDGSAFGPVADFYTLGKMSGQMASRLLLEGNAPSSMSSLLQQPPVYLINKKSFERLNLTIPDTLTQFEYAN